MPGELDQGEYIAEDDNDNNDTDYHVVRDTSGRITSVDNGNGSSIEYSYDDQGDIKSVTDTGSGTKIERQEDGSWAVVGPGGSKQPIDGTVTVDQNSGSVSAHLDNGTKVSTSPNGDITVVDGKGRDQEPAGGDNSGLK